MRLFLEPDTKTLRQKLVSAVLKQHLCFDGFLNTMC